jgi:hypothetical protein
MVGMIAELHGIHARRHQLAMSLSGRVVATTGKVSVPGQTAADALALCGATPTKKVGPPRPGKKERAAEVLIVGSGADERALNLAAKHGLLVLGEADLLEILRVRVSLIAEQRVGLEPSLVRARKDAAALRVKGTPGRMAVIPGALPSPDDYRRGLSDRQDGFRSRIAG